MTLKFIEEAGLPYKLSVQDLLRLGAQGVLPIYTVPNAKLHLDATIVAKVEAKAEDYPLGPEFYVADAVMTGSMLSTLVLRISPLNLTNFLSYPDDATIDVFQAEVINGGIGVLRPTSGTLILVKDCRLQVSLTELEQIAPKQPSGSTPRRSIISDGRTREMPTSEQTSEQKMLTAADSLAPALKSLAVVQRSGYLRRDDVAALVGVSRNTIRNYEKKEGFPAPIRISGRTVVWLHEDVTAWVESWRKKPHAALEAKKPHS